MALVYPISDANLPTRTTRFSATAAECATLSATTGGTIVRDIGKWETAGGSVKMVCAAASTVQFYIDLPAPITCLSELKFRVRSSNWRNFKAWQIRLNETLSATTNYHYCNCATYSSSTCYDSFHCIARAWPDEWRWIKTIPTYYVASGSPTAWGTASDNATKTINRIGIQIQAIDGAAAELWLDAIEEEDWGHGRIVVNFDGMYAGAQAYLMDPMLTAGYNFSATSYAVSDDPFWSTESLDPTFYPSMATVGSWATTLGRNVSVHAMNANAASLSLGFSAANKTNANDVIKGIRQAVERTANFSGMPRTWNPAFIHGVLGNNGYCQEGDFAAALRDCGILASRGTCSDALFGCFGISSDWPTGYAIGAPVSDNNLLGINSFCPRLGPYNYVASGLATRTYEQIETSVNRADWHHLVRSMYVHNVNATGDSTNISTTIATQVLALFATKVAAGMELCTIADLYDMTYGRQGRWYVDHWGNWVDRQSELSGRGIRTVLRNLTTRQNRVDRAITALPKYGVGGGQGEFLGTHARLIESELPSTQVADSVDASTTGQTVTAGVPVASSSVAEIAGAVWASLTSALTTAGSIGRYILSRLTVGASGGAPADAIDADVDAFVTIPVNGTKRLLKRVYKNGLAITQADIASIACTVYALDADDITARTAVAGHTAVSVTVADAVSDAMQTDAEWGNYNFAHTPDISAANAFSVPGGLYLVEYTFMPTSGQKIITRFRVNVI